MSGIADLCVITLTVHWDKQEYFMETYNQKKMEEFGLSMIFAQDNQFSSIKGAFRGLHVQKQFSQGKLVLVVHGSVYDVAVDIRNGSETYGKWLELK